MATKSGELSVDAMQSIEVSALEKQWIVVSLELKRKALARARENELVGSEVHVFRGKEISQLDQLINRFR